ncbi:hypothetical protein AALB16_09135 [Lachnospiraceae bacterium 62-35]
MAKHINLQKNYSLNQSGYQLKLPLNIEKAKAIVILFYSAWNPRILHFVQILEPYIDRVWYLTSVEFVEDVVWMNLQFAFRNRSRLFFYGLKQMKAIFNSYNKEYNHGKKI